MFFVGHGHTEAIGLAEITSGNALLTDTSNKRKFLIVMYCHPKLISLANY